MQCIIAGSRRFPSLGINEKKDWNNKAKFDLVYQILEECIVESGFDITVVISGTCWGMDQLGEAWANRNDRPVRYYPADWRKYGKAAGPIRNKQMGDVGECLLCIHTPDSRGTLNMISHMKRQGKPLFSRVIA